MLSLGGGKPIAQIRGGKLNGEIVCIWEEKKCCSKHSEYCKMKPCCNKCNIYDVVMIGKKLELKNGIMVPIVDLEQRSVNYIAGPSGSGKSTIASKLIKGYCSLNPEKPLYIFSRTNPKDDPAFKNLKYTTVPINQDLLIENPIDIKQDLAGGSIVLFDDCNTIQDDKLKKAVEKIIEDILEVGRKMDITIFITNHLIVPNERRFARTIMNELQTLTIFPQSGSAYQIEQVLCTYFGVDKNRVKKEILSLPSRWVMVKKNFPRTVLHEKGAFIL